MSRVTTVQWFCDRCGKELPGRPGRVYVTSDNSHEMCFGRVIIDYMNLNIRSSSPDKFEEEIADSVLCDKCKTDLLADLIKRLSEV